MRVCAFLLATWLSLSVSLLHAAPPRVLPTGKVPNDKRLGKLKDLNGYFPFYPPKTKAEWEQRAEELRRRILVATGLWPMPEKTPLKPVIHGLVKRDGFTVEKVYFESYPGLYVTGLLFRPADGKEGKRPAVLCPHGHGGRLQDYGAKQIRWLIVEGAERFEASGRFPKLARCAQLARMGCVTFIYDMLGYADNVQISSQLAHRFAKQRPDFDNKESWGLFSTQAELRCQSVMGIQTWNSIRALDFLCQLPDVDPTRVGVTGGSGGGTQTILLCAIDPRPVVAFPQGMVSTSMQGGCTCENCCLLRIGTGNVELAALFAPKPQAMTAANDWTREMMTKGYPQLQQLYALYGAKDKVFCKEQLHFPHNYNYVTRALMYRWFNRHLKLGLEEPIVEEDFPPLTPEEYTVWDDKHPKPKGGPEFERQLLKQIDEASNKQIAALTPKDEQSLARYRTVIGGAVDIIIGRALPKSSDLDREKVGKVKRDDYIEFTDLIRFTRHDEELPVVFLYPTNPEWNREVVIWLDGEGKSALFTAKGMPKPEIQRLLDKGYSVASADLLYQGEFLKDGQKVTQNRVVSNPREFAGYTFCYNHPLFAQRVHDILTLTAFVLGDQHNPDKVHLVGVNGAGPWVAAARAQAANKVAKAAIDTQGFRFVDLKSYRDINFLPGIVKYGDLPALLALSAPQPLWLAGENGKVPPITAAAYQAAGKPKNVVSYAGKNVADAIVDWLSR
ncbi:MAG: acetylxylan esterase [Gemmatales bacterium]|nr:MAG: acetylxylan esterase [Gemmatales bacterium]